MNLPDLFHVSVNLLRSKARFSVTVDLHRWIKFYAHDTPLPLNEEFGMWHQDIFSFGSICTRPHHLDPARFCFAPAPAMVGGSSGAPRPSHGAFEIVVVVVFGRGVVRGREAIAAIEICKSRGAGRFFFV